MVHYLGQDWNPLCKDSQWIYMNHYNDHDWTHNGKLQQSTLPTGILQWESGESGNGEQVLGEQYFYNMLLIFNPTIVPVAMPQGNGEHIHPNGNQIPKASFTIHDGETRIKDPTNPPSGVSMHKAPIRVWDPGHSAFY